MRLVKVMPTALFMMTVSLQLQEREEVLSDTCIPNDEIKTNMSNVCLTSLLQILVLQGDGEGKMGGRRQEIKARSLQNARDSHHQGFQCCLQFLLISGTCPITLRDSFLRGSFLIGNSSVKGLFTQEVLLRSPQFSGDLLSPTFQYLFLFFFLLV